MEGRHWKMEWYNSNLPTDLCSQSFGSCQSEVRVRFFLTCQFWPTLVLPSASSGPFPHLPRCRCAFFLQDVDAQNGFAAHTCLVFFSYSTYQWSVIPTGPSLLLTPSWLLCSHTEGQSTGSARLSTSLTGYRNRCAPLIKPEGAGCADPYSLLTLSCGDVSNLK